MGDVTKKPFLPSVREMLSGGSSKKSPNKAPDKKPSPPPSLGTINRKIVPPNKLDLTLQKASEVLKKK